MQRPGGGLARERRGSGGATVVVVVSSSGASRARGAWQWCQGGAVPGKQGAQERFWAEARRVGRPGGFAGIRRRRRHGAGEQR